MRCVYFENIHSWEENSKVWAVPSQCTRKGDSSEAQSGNTGVSKVMSAIALTYNTYVYIYICMYIGRSSCRADTAH